MPHGRNAFHSSFLSFQVIPGKVHASGWQSTLEASMLDKFKSLTLADLCSGILVMWHIRIYNVLKAFFPYIV